MTALKIADLQEAAREEGAYQNKLETAENLLQDGFSPEMISKYTGLPLETIRGLIQRGQ